MGLKQKIYTYRFLDDFILIYPLYAVMFSDKGLDAAHIASLFFAWSLTGILFEIPTGILADKFSRRKLLAIGQIIQAIGYAAWLLIPNYWGFLIGFVLWGIKGALDSGTFEALLFDEMKAGGEEGKYVRVMGTAQSLSLVGNIVATALAAAAILLGYSFVLVASIIVPLLTAAIAMTLPEAKKQESLEEEEEKYLHTIVRGVKTAFSNPAILRIVLLLAFVAVIYGDLEEYFPLFAANIALPKFAIPLVLVGTGLAAALGSYLAYRYNRANRLLIATLLAVSGLCLVVAASSTKILAAAILVLFVFFIQLLLVVFEGRLQHAIEGKARATITSVSSFVTEIGSMLFFVLYGFFAQRHGNVGTFKIAGFVVLAVAAISIFAGLPRQRSKKTGEPHVA